MLMKAIFGVVLVGTLFARAETILSPLKVGDSIPDVTLRSIAGEGASLRKLLSAKPDVLMFYRGGRCPFCNKHLKSLSSIEEDPTKEGVQWIAISMDQPLYLRNEKVEATAHDRHE
jgi:peroxiredoxin